MVEKYYRQAFGIVPAMSIVALVAAMVLASGATGDRVLGQLDFVHVAPNLVDARGLFTPRTVAIDASVSPNRLYVADADNNRVLGWKNSASFANGAPADLVIGQPDFISSNCIGASASSLCGPAAAAVDASGNLYVADSSNKPRARVCGSICRLRQYLPVRGRSCQPGVRTRREFLVEGVR